MLLCTRQGTINRKAALNCVDKVVVSPSGLECLVTVPGEHDLLVTFPSATTVSHCFVPAMKHLTFVNVMHLGVGQAIGDADHPIEYGTPNAHTPEADRRFRKSPPLHPLVPLVHELPAVDSDEETSQRISFTDLKRPQRPQLPLPPPPPEEEEEDFNAVWQELLRQEGGGVQQRSPKRVTVQHPQGVAPAPRQPVLKWKQLPKWKAPVEEEVVEPVSPLQLLPASSVVASAEMVEAEMQTEPSSQLCPGCAGSAEYGCLSWCPSRWYPPAGGVSRARTVEVHGASAFDPSSVRNGAVIFAEEGSTVTSKKNDAVIVRTYSCIPPEGVCVYEVVLCRDTFQRCAVGVCVEHTRRIELRSDGVLTVDGNKISQHRSLRPEEVVIVRVDRCLHQRVTFRSKQTRELLCQFSFASASPRLEGMPRDYYLTHDLSFFVRLHNSKDKAKLLRCSVWSVSPEVVMCAGVLAALSTIVCDKSIYDSGYKLRTISNENIAMRDEITALEDRYEATLCDNTRLSDRADTVTAEAEALKEELTQAASLNASLTRQTATHEADTTALQERIAELEEQAETHKTEFCALSRMVRKVEADNVKANAELTHARTALEAERNDTPLPPPLPLPLPNRENDISQGLRSQIAELESKLRKAERNERRHLKDPTREQVRQLAEIIDVLVVNSESQVVPALPESMAGLNVPVGRLVSQRANERRILAMSKSRPGLVLNTVLSALAEGDPAVAQRALQTQCPDLVPDNTLRRLHCRYGQTAAGVMVQLHTTTLTRRYYTKLALYAKMRRRKERHRSR